MIWLLVSTILWCFALVCFVGSDCIVFDVCVLIWVGLVVCDSVACLLSGFVSL